MILDVGCDTGIPVAQIFSGAGYSVTGIDISSSMVELAPSCVRGRFLVGNVLSFQLEEQYVVTLMLFAHYHLNYAASYAAVHRFAPALEPQSSLVVGQIPSDETTRGEDSASANIVI